MKRLKQQSGGSRMKTAGKKAILLGVAVPEWEFLHQAAQAERRPLTQYILYHVFLAAKKTLLAAPTGETGKSA